MKLLSIAIPCYNSESCMSHCIESLLPGGDEVEIIIVNDGSTKDNTLQVARNFEAKYPGIIKVVDKPNGGHGSAVNYGLKNSTGLYFKVVDSDDWVDEKAYPKILETLRSFSGDENQIDMLLSNFIYDKQGAKHKKTVNFRKVLPVGQIFGWDSAKKFPVAKYILMHSIIYRTQVLKDINFELPEHCFYVDNLFAFIPFPSTKKIFYLDVDFYHYFIGRDDQSVNEKVMIKRIDQQLRVNYIMVQEFKKYEAAADQNPHLKDYMYSYLEGVTGVSSIMCILSKDKELYEKKDKLWQYIKENDLETYKKLKSRIYGVMHITTPFRNFVSRIVYRVSKKIFGFN